MLTGLRDDATRWVIGIAAGGLLLLIMGWSATQPTMHYSLAAGCTGYGNSQDNCQSQAGAAAATGGVQAATTGMPNTGQEDVVRDALIGVDLVLIGATMLLAIRRRSGRAPAP
jgi:hypothetical protein